MDNEEDTNNVFTIVPGNKSPVAKEDQLPTNTYDLIDVEGSHNVYEGFLVFTSQHVAVMREVENVGAIPVAVMPLHRLAIAEVVDTDEEELPF